MIEAFIWNLVFVGKVIEEYSQKHPKLVIEWSIPDGDLDSLVLLMGTTEAYSLEKKYLLYYEIEELEPFELRQLIEGMLEEMAKKVISS